jgi:glycosyltransferase involved in cell wall biosynthesis
MEPQEVTADPASGSSGAGTAGAGRQLRVLKVMPGVDGDGGAEQSLLATAPGLIARGVDLHLVVLTSRQDLVPALRACGVTVHDRSHHRSVLGRARSIRRLVRELRPDLVHATLYAATVPTQLAITGTRTPLLISWATTGYNADRRAEPGTNPLTLGRARLVEMLFGRLSGSWYHAVTEGVARANAADLRVRPERVLVGERGRDASRIDAARVAARPLQGVSLPEDAKVVLAVGRQDASKGYDCALPAFDQVAARHPEAVMLIAGREGSASANIAEVLAGMRHAAQVHLLGQREDVPELLMRADVIVCASWREGAAGALLEAMAAGTPVVCVRVAGLEGVCVHEVNALVVERTELGGALSRVLDDPDLAARLAAEGRRTFEERFTVDAATTRLVEIYRIVLGRSTE